MKKNKGDNGEIPVVFTPDENFIVQTCIAIMSMLETKKQETDYVFYIIVSERLSTDKLKFFEHIKTIYLDFKYEIIKFDSTIFDKQKMFISHISTSTLYRLVIAEILLYDKCIYHDGDILVYEDLQEMYDINLDEYYVAGINALLNENTDKSKIEQWHFKSLDNYIIAGNLVFNLKKIRENQLIEDFIREMKKGYPEGDQDVLNYCCYDKIYCLPLKYGMLNRWINNKILFQEAIERYSLKAIEEAIRKPAVIHFAGANTKPWNNLRVACGKKWWNYAKKILTLDEFRKWYSSALEQTRKRDWNYFENLLDRDSEIIIFGYSKISRGIFDSLKNKSYNIKCFVDNDKSKWRQNYLGVEVLKPDEVLQEKNNYIIINSSQNYRKEINEQLFNNNISEKQIVQYYNKNEIYYMALEKEYYEVELRDLCYREYSTYYNELDYMQLLEEFKGKEQIKEKYFMKDWIFSESIMNE